MTKESEDNQLPYVSVVMPMRNEEKYIAQCLDTIIANDYPSELFEIIIADGLSTDRSPEIVREYMRRYKNIRLISNPKRIRVAGNNVGIRAARGDIIVNMDAHTLYAPDYIRHCVELLQTTGAASVGTNAFAVGYNYVARAIALATTTPFGIGNAEFRYSKKEKAVDTLFLGSWYKTTLEEIGLFNEEWEINGDAELNYRLRKAGGTILLSPKLKCQYIVRSSLPKLARQYFRYGIWRLKTIVTHPDTIRWRHLPPPLLILWLLLSFVLLGFRVPLWWIPLGSYLLYTFITSSVISLLNGIHYFPILIPTLWTLHICWGCGFYAGIIKSGLPRIKISLVLKDILGKMKLE